MKNYKTVLLLGSFVSISPSLTAMEAAAEAELQAQTAMQAQMVMRDPFTPSPLMYQIRGTEIHSYSQAGAFSPNDAVSLSIPDMRLRGFVADDDKKMLALLEVVGRGVYMVREGDEININPRRPSEAIRITSITRLGITVETGTIGKIRILK